MVRGVASFPIHSINTDARWGRMLCGGRNILAVLFGQLETG